MGLMSKALLSSFPVTITISLLAFIGKVFLELYLLITENAESTIS